MIVEMALVVDGVILARVPAKDNVEMTVSFLKTVVADLEASDLKASKIRDEINAIDGSYPDGGSGDLASRVAEYRLLGASNGEVTRMIIDCMNSLKETYEGMSR